MRRRLFAAIAVGLLLTTAGCGGVLDEGKTRTPYDVDPTATATPTPVPTETTTQMPERAAASFVANASEQAIKLRGLESYAIRYNYTEVGPEGVRNASTTVIRVNRSQRREFVYLRPRVGDRTVRGGLYQDGDQLLQVVYLDDGPRYDRSDQFSEAPGNYSVKAWDEAVTGMVAADLQRNGTEAVDGERMIRYTAEGTEAAPPSTEDIVAYRLTVLVDDDGLLRRIERREVEPLDGNGTVTEHSHVRLTGIGTTTVERPEWVEEALAATETTTASRTSEGETTTSETTTANRTGDAETTATDRRSTVADPRNVE